MIEQEDVQLVLTVLVGSGRAIPSYLTGKPVTALLGIWDVDPLKRAGGKVSFSASSIGWNDSPMYEVTLCKKYHSSWRDFCIPS